MGNALILIALKNVSSIHPPTKLFFRCLAVTDLCVGLIVQPLYATYIISHIIKMNANVLYYAWKIYEASGFILGGVSVLTSTAISADRLLALLLGLRYRHVVTLRRARVVITCFWLIAASVGWLSLWRRDITFMPATGCLILCLTSTAISVDRLLALLLGLRYRHVVTLKRVRVVIACFWLMAATIGCLRVWRIQIAVMAGTVVLIPCLVTSIFCYTRIHLKLRHQQAQVQNNVPQRQQNGEGIPLNIARYKKTVSSIMWVQLALVACYVPWVIVAMLHASGIKDEVAWRATQTLMYLNSSLNPILYCWQIREVKQAVKVARLGFLRATPLKFEN